MQRNRAALIQKRLSLIFLALFLPLASPTATAYSQTSFFPIESYQRGSDFVALVNGIIAGTISVNPAYDPYRYELGIQTTGLYYSYPYVTNSNLIPYVQKITPMTYETMFIVQYSPPNNSRGRPLYLALPIETIVGAVYSTLSFTPYGSTTTYPTTELPLLTISPANRAADIKQIITTLLASGSVYNPNGQSYVSLQTTLGGSVNVNGISNGVIPFIQSVTPIPPYNTILLVNYQAQFHNPQLYSVIVDVEQVQQVIYYQE